MKLEFSQQFSNNFQISSFMKILPVEVNLFRASRLLDITKLITAFLSLVKAHNEGLRMFGACLVVRKYPSSVMTGIIHY